MQRLTVNPRQLPPSQCFKSNAFSQIRNTSFSLQAQKRTQTVAMSAVTQEGTAELMSAMEVALSSQMEYISCIISYNHVTLLSTVHNMGILDEVQYLDEGVFVRGKVPMFLKDQIENRSKYEEEDAEEGEVEIDYEYLDIHVKDDGEEDSDFDWSGMAKGRHSARRDWEANNRDSSDLPFRNDVAVAVMSTAIGSAGHSPSADTASPIRVSSARDKGTCSTDRQRKKQSIITGEKKRKPKVENGDDFSDTAKLLDFDAGDYDGSSINVEETDEE